MSLTGEPPMPDRVYPAIQTMKPTGSYALRHGRAAQPEGEKLGDRDHAVLMLSNR